MQDNQEPSTSRPKLKIKAPPPGLPPAASPVRKKSGSLIGRIASIVIVGGVVVAGVMIKRGQLELPDHPLLNNLLPAEQKAVPVPASHEVGAVAEPAPEKQIWRNQDFIEGAKLFNRVLADYKSQQQSSGDPSELASIRESCRNAIALFQSALEVSPPDMAVKINDYIEQCERLLVSLDEDNSNPEQRVASRGGDVLSGPIDLGIKIEMKGDAPRRTIVYEDDDPGIEAQAVAGREEEIKSSRLSFNPAWDQQIPDAGGIADALHDLLQERITVIKKPVLDAGIPVYSNITTLTSARVAASRLNQSLPIKRPLDTPGFPANSLFTYTFEGEFTRGANRFILVVDVMDRVVMSQLRFDQPAQSVLLPREQHEVFDYLDVQRKINGSELIGHRVRVNDQMVFIESELMESNPGPDGKRASKSRIQWIIPRQMAGLILGSRP